MWGSRKVGSLPPDLKTEFAWLLPLALANGVFEAEDQIVWAKCYGPRRPEVPLERVTTILKALETSELLIRWQDKTGKIWGYWVGIDKPGRLPGKSRRGRNEATGPEPPRHLLRKQKDSSMETNGIHKHPDGNEKLLGFGVGLGSGSGIGSGSVGEKVPEFDGEQWVEDILNAHPKPIRGYGYQTAILEKIEKEAKFQFGGDMQKGAEFILRSTQAYAETVGTWPMAFNSAKFFSEELYAWKPEAWPNPNSEMSQRDINNMREAAVGTNWKK